jgi:hypothetical protein
VFTVNERFLAKSGRSRVPKRSIEFAPIVRRFAGQDATVAFSYAGPTNAAKALADETEATTIPSDAADRASVIAVYA